MKTNPLQKLTTPFVAAALGVLAAPAVFAASQTWSNAPTSSAWQTAANWIGNAVPGAVNSSTTADIATFNSPLPLSGIGGAAQPIVNDLQRGIRSIRFDTADCGAYVFGSSPADNSLELTHLGDISIAAAVTNPIVFNQGIRLRVPNSTNQRFDITNNAADPQATLYFGVITNGTANTRPWLFFLGGANTGTNTIARIDDSPAGGTAGSSGAILLDKVGSGTWILSGANDLPQKTSAGNVARAQIVEGTLIVKDPASLGSLAAANILVTNTGVLQIDGITLNNLGMSLRHGGTIRMNGSGAIHGLVVGNQAGLVASLATTSATDVFTVGSLSVVSGGASDSVVRMVGAGTFQLGTANTYVGNWSFEAKTNQLTGFSLANSRNVHLAAGAILDSAALGGTYALESATFSADGTGTVVGGSAATIDAGAAGTFDLGNKPIALSFAPTSFAGDTTHPALYVAQGTLVLNANAFTVNNTSGTPLGSGTYRLIQQAAGNITSAGTPFVIVTGAGIAAGNVAEIQVSGGNVNLLVVPHVAANLKWQGGNPDNKWDKVTTANWFNGTTAVQFQTGDNVTFDVTGTLFPTVDITETVLPASVVVDTTSNDYTLGGAGNIAGPTGVTKVGAGNLILSTINAYVGGTVVSNGTLRLGVAQAIPSSGAGNVAVYSPGVIDLNSLDNSVNALIGNGTVDNQSGGASVLTVGLNGSSSTFTGLLASTSGSLALTKAGNGQLTLPGAHTYSGGTIINAGTVEVRQPTSLGSGAVTINGGALRTTTNLNLNNLTGAQGTTIANVSGSGATTLTHNGTGNYTGVISDGTGSTMGLYVASGTLQLNAANTYTRGTIVASGATLAIGVINPGGSGTAGAGGITASNGALISLPTTVSTAAAPGNNITNVEASGTITLSSASQGNSFNGLFVGGANNTNIFVGPGSIGGANTFTNFAGTVLFSNASSWRWFNANNGGNNATFIIDTGATLFSRDASTIRLGALAGEGTIGNPSVSAPATYLIGGKNLATTFPGAIAGSNNITKIGTASLTLNGVRYFTNTVTLPDTSVVDYPLFTNAVTYIGNTTVSNGTLAITAPNNLTNSPNITLAGGTLDVSALGSWSNQTTLDINATEQPTNTVIITTGILDILAGQTLNGFGSLVGSATLDAAAINHVGDSIAGTNVVRGIGTLAISGSYAINGTVNMDLNRSNPGQNSDRVTAASFSGSGATLNINVTGPTLISGTVFPLFNGPVSAFTTVNLPATDATGQIAYTWQNDLAVNGSITLVSGLSAAPAPITAVIGGGGATLDLSWPPDHRGWTLQTQTNSLIVGISNNWFDVPGSTTNISASVPIVRTNPTVFYRLRLPLP